MQLPAAGLALLSTRQTQRLLSISRKFQSILGLGRLCFPVDGITDSKTERYSYQSDVLTSGEHVIAFRTYDQNDNVGIGKLVVRIP